MVEEPATATYSVAEPFAQTVKSLRRLLSSGNLRIAAELDLSGRVRDRLMIEMTPCLVLLVSPTACTFCGDPSVQALIPLHVVVSGRETGQTDIHMLRSLPREEEGVPGWSALAEWNHVQAEISRILEKIAMRVPLGV